MTTKTICIECDHPISEHTYSESFIGCDKDDCNCNIDLGAYIDKLNFDISLLRAELTNKDKQITDWRDTYDITMPCGHKNRYLLINAQCLMCEMENLKGSE